jgi:hypothetical protein
MRTAGFRYRVAAIVQRSDCSWRWATPPGFNSVDCIRLFFATLPLMGSERSSTVRQRLSGKICALCRSPLPPPHIPGEQLCESCGAKRKPPAVSICISRLRAVGTASFSKRT